MAICRTTIEGKLVDFKYSVIEQGKEGKKCSYCGQVKPLIKIYSGNNAETQIPFPIGRKRREELIPRVIEDWTESLSPEEGYPPEWEVCSYCGAAKFIGDGVDENSESGEVDKEELIRASIENRPPYF
jgi:hypothetical protein